MESHFVWQEDYNIGVEVIDREHQRLFHIINKIFDLRREGKSSRWACEQGIRFFKGHAVRHFDDEEAYMAAHGFEGLEQHRSIHRSFRERTLPALEAELEQTGYAPEAVDHFLGVCAGWLIGHTRTEDQAITGRPMPKWAALLSVGALADLEKLVVRLIFDMFHLESHLISSAYGGEKFGSGVYYRLSYASRRDEKRLEILMVFEETLLINTVGKVLGLQTNKLDTLLVHAARYTARQFVGRVLEHTPDGPYYELEEENLLSYGQFREAFGRRALQVSLLFDTGAGYFAYCVAAPHRLDAKIGTPLLSGNAAQEVERYLSRREAQAGVQRKKILVVDDSATIRRGMQALLGGDYEVSAAESGIAAIRAITLDRPDLVLLDYEMPICDGRRTLEMLRTEASLADLPVMFLTGRSDPDVVRQLVSLKPAGYLLKDLKPEAIKGKIDSYFEP